MSMFPGGWLDLESSMPQKISDKLVYVAINDGANVDEGVVELSSNYNSPTGGS